MRNERLPSDDRFEGVLVEQIEVAALFIDEDPIKRGEAVDRLDYMPPEEQLRYTLESLTTYGRTVTMLLAEQLGIDIEDVHQYILDRTYDQVPRDGDTPEQ